MTLLDKLNRLPPVVARLLAKSNGKLMSDIDLCKRTGWGKKRLRRVYRAGSWRNVTVEEVDVFLAACGLKWSSQRRERWLLKLAWNRSGLSDMRHLKASTGWEASMINKLNKHVETFLS